MAKVKWPINPREGQEFSYICPISGASFVFFIYRNGKWEYLRTE